MDEPVRWTVRVSKDTDVAVRRFLAQRGMKESDLAKFIEEAVRWRVLGRTVAETKARNSKAPVAGIEAAIDEALKTVRAERFAQLGEKESAIPTGWPRRRAARRVKTGGRVATHFPFDTTGTDLLLFSSFLPWLKLARSAGFRQEGGAATLISTQAVLEH